MAAAKDAALNRPARRPRFLGAAIPPRSVADPAFRCADTKIYLREILDLLEWAVSGQEAFSGIMSFRFSRPSGSTKETAHGVLALPLVPQSPFQLR